MVVYLDVLLGLNLYVDYFLLLAVSKITACPIKKRRILVGAVVLALGSLVLFLPPLPLAVNLLLRITMAFSGAFVAFGRHPFKRFFRLVATLFGVTFAFGGILYGFWHAFHPTGLLMINGAFYYTISPVVLTVSTLLCYGILWVIRRIRTPGRSITAMVLHLQQGGQTVTVQAKLDTGFTLRDIYSDSPVILLSPCAANRLFHHQELSLRLLPYETVGETGLLQSGICDRLVVEYSGQKVLLTKVVVAIAPKDFPAEFDALVGCDLVERMDWNENQTMDCAMVEESVPPAHRLHKRSHRFAASAGIRGGASVNGTSAKGR